MPPSEFFIPGSLVHLETKPASPLAAGMPERAIAFFVQSQAFTVIPGASEGKQRVERDLDVFATAVADGYVLLTENVADFARIAADHLTAGQHHPGVLIALSSRFSRRPVGRGALVTAIAAIVHEPLADRIVFLQHTDRA